MCSAASNAFSVSSGLMLLSLQGTAKVSLAQGTSPGSPTQGGALQYTLWQRSWCY